jgi:AraC-like DNA-binding protein
MDLIGFLYGFGFLHGVILAGILLYSQTGNRRANAFMAALVACIAIRFLYSCLIRAGVFTRFPEWSLFSIPLDFAWGPLLYLYAYAMSARPVRLAHLLHFIPCALLFSAPITFALSPREQQLEFLGYLWSNRENVETGRNVLSSLPAFWRTWVELHLQGSLFSVQFGTYCYLVLRQIRNHNLKLERHFSFTDKMNLRWLSVLTYMCALFLLLFLAFNRGGLVLYGQFEITALSANMPFLFLVLGLYIIGIGALYQPRIRSSITGSDDSDPDPMPVLDSEPESEQGKVESHSPEPVPVFDGAQAASESTKYARSGITIEDAQRYKIRLMRTMQEQKLYLDCDLTLRDLAEQAGMSYHQASQVINGQMNQRFFSFVNDYRIQLAKELLADPKTSKMAIVDLAMEVGFKSKSSFYDAFKKVARITPTQFKKSLQEAV